MKLKITSLLLLAAMLFVGCEKDKPTEVILYDVVVAVSAPAEYAENVDYSALKVSAQSSENMYEQAVDADGKATFELPAGSYTFKTNGSIIVDNNALSISSISTQIIDQSWDQTSELSLELSITKNSQLIIKEIYTTGCADAVEEGDTYLRDRMFVIYNNSDFDASLDNVGLAICDPYNAQSSSNKWIVEGGELFYENEDWINATHGIWYFQDGHKLAARSQAVVSLGSALNHTDPQTNSIDLSTADYVTYDPESGYNHSSWYPAPYEGIPSTNYLKAARYGLGNGWTVSSSSPSLIIFNTVGTTPAAFAADLSYEVYAPGDDFFVGRKLPKEWVLDAIEVWNVNFVETSTRRISKDLDAGLIYASSGLGQSIYRNVDKEATEAIEENQGKLVYNYALGTQNEELGSTDPSGIDAEASMAAGAKIVFKDINDSSVDFHRRSVVSLKK